MNVEKTIEFILENMSDLTVKQARTDRQIRGLQTIVKTGMRMLAKMQEQGIKVRQEIAKTQQELRELAAAQKESQKRTDRALAELAEAQKRTDEKFQRWLDRSSNGRGR